MTEAIFLDEPYTKTAFAQVVRHTEEGGVVLDRSIFFAQSDGQPGDSGRLIWEGGELEVSNAIWRGEEIILLPGMATPLPPMGTRVEQRLDWKRRYSHMKMHTAVHLLSTILGVPVKKTAIGREVTRVEALQPSQFYDKNHLTARLSQLVSQNCEVSAEMAGEDRAVRILDREKREIDVQPCTGTHVQRTAEIAGITVKGIDYKKNRRITFTLTH